MGLKPFWRYYGGKYRAAPRYPKPQHSTIIEPFAGAAGYSLRYPERRIVLVEKNDVVAAIWAYLIGVKESEINAIPCGATHVDEFPAWVPQEAKNLIGWWFNNATTTPCKSLSAGRIKLATMGRKFEGWTEATKHRVASQLSAIRHWTIIHGDYTQSPDERATYFVDPPYNNKCGAEYPCGASSIDYSNLGSWCKQREGQVIVCENEGASWLDFKHFALLKPGINGKGSHEVIWEGGR